MRYWLKILLFLPLLGCLAVGCSNDESLVGPVPDKAALGPVDVIINEYRVTYEGRTYLDGETTFHWNVAGTGEGHILDYFWIEAPECAGEPVSWEPTEDSALRTNEEFDLYGVKWFRSISPQDLEGQQYAITFAGDVPEGTVRALVNGAEPTLMGEIAGPCAGYDIAVYDIAGTVFADSDTDSLFSPATESGIGNVIVELIDAEAQVDTVRTAADGSYSFTRPAGTYTVRIDTLGYTDAFNPQLGYGFLPTTPLAQEVTIGPEELDVDFGFTVNVDRVLRDLEDDVLPTIGEGPLFWKVQLKVADQLEHQFEVPPLSEIFYGPVRMHIFLDMIRHLYLVDPYVFDPETELLDVFWVLSKPTKTDVGELRKQLLTSELNFVSNQGILGPRAELLGPLIAWGEGILAVALQQEGATSPLLKARDPVTDALAIFRAVNTGGGGTIDE